MTTGKKDQLIKRLEELESEIDGFRQDMETMSEDDDDDPTDEGEKEKAITLRFTKKNSPEITEEDIASLRACARLKGLVLGDVVRKPEQDEA